MEAGVDVRFCDLPQIEGPTGRFLLQSMMSVAELEAGMISARTKAALAASKARGKTLGGFRGRAGTSADLAKARAARSLTADAQADALAPILARIDPTGANSLRVVAALRGHRSAIDALVAFQIKHKRSQLQALDEVVDELLHCRTDGRPNKYTALRDFFIFTQYVLLQSVGRLEVREARKRTALMFGLTSDTKFARSRRPSVDQVKWAEERTMTRFALLRSSRGSELLGPTWLKCVYVLGFYIGEMGGTPLDPEAFFTDATRLILICRWLDAFEKLDRLEKGAARKAAKRLEGRCCGSPAPGASAN